MIGIEIEKLFLVWWCQVEVNWGINWKRDWRCIFSSRWHCCLLQLLIFHTQLSSKNHKSNFLLHALKVNKHKFSLALASNFFHTNNPSGGCSCSLSFHPTNIQRGNFYGYARHKRASSYISHHSQHTHIY